MFRQKKTRYNAFDKEKCNCGQFMIKRTVMMGGAGMQFRPCIDIHNGKVKQIVGSSLKDQGNMATENFVAEHDADYFAALYKEHEIEGAHIILLNSKDSEYYEATRKQALLALRTYPGHMQVGGGINAENAKEYLEAGAKQVIVTSYVFKDGQLSLENLEKLVRAVGKEHVVLDLSCRKKDGQYYIVTDRWQKYTDMAITAQNLDFLAKYAEEFLIHAVDVEGKSGGIEEELVQILGAWNKIPITYAGGVHAYEDLDLLYRVGEGKIHVTIGSALDLYGGPMKFEEVEDYIRKLNREQ